MLPLGIKCGEMKSYLTSASPTIFTAAYSMATPRWWPLTLGRATPQTQAAVWAAPDHGAAR